MNRHELITPTADVRAAVIVLRVAKVARKAKAVNNKVGRIAEDNLTAAVEAVKDKAVGVKVVVVISAAADPAVNKEAVVEAIEADRMKSPTCLRSR